MLDKVKSLLNSDHIFIVFLKKFFYKIKKDNVTAIGAQLSYYLFMSIFPFLIVFLNILSFIPRIQSFLVDNLLVRLPYDIKVIIVDLINETVSSSSETLLSVGAITGIWAASKGAKAFINIMNEAYEVKECRSFIWVRILAVFYTIAIFIAFILVLLTLVFGEIIGNKFFSYLGLAQEFSSTWNYFRKILSLVSIIIIFAGLFKFGPAKNNGKRLKIIDTLPGAVFSSIGWILTSSLFAFYVNNFGKYSKTYGSIGGVLALLLWLYISSVIVIVGAELNATLQILKEDPDKIKSEDFCT